MRTTLVVSSVLFALSLAGCSAADLHAHPAAGAPVDEGISDVPAADAVPPQTEEPAPVEPPPPPGPDHGSITGTVNVTPSTMGKSVIVYIKDGPIDAAKVTPATVDQKGMNFIPFVTVVVVGAKVTFLNDDPFPHNVFSPDGERFNLGTSAQGHAKAKVFSKPGSYTLLCNLHPNMLAYVFVSPSTYYTKVDTKKSFVLTNVPNGTYTLAAWAPRLPEQTQQVTIAGADLKVELQLHR